MKSSKFKVAVSTARHPARAEIKALENAGIVLALNENECVFLATQDDPWWGDIYPVARIFFKEPVLQQGDFLWLPETDGEKLAAVIVGEPTSCNGDYSFAADAIIFRCEECRYRKKAMALGSNLEEVKRILRREEFVRVKAAVLEIVSERGENQ